MQKINYQKMLDEVIEKNQKNGIKPTLLLHACCAPCSSYVLEYLNQFFDITMFFYNPNISPREEFEFRLSELKRLINEMNLNIKVTVGEYDSDLFYENSKGHESEPEGGERCFKCYEMRLRKTALLAKCGGFDYFTTTLSISPYKNAEKLNEIGGRLSEEYGVKYLYSDFKKKNGYKSSIELSKIYSLYRQDYCGCVFSKEITRKLRAEKEKNDK